MYDCFFKSILFAIFSSSILFPPAPAAPLRLLPLQPVLFPLLGTAMTTLSRTPPPLSALRGALRGALPSAVSGGRLEATPERECVHCHIRLPARLSEDGWATGRGKGYPPVMGSKSRKGWRSRPLCVSPPPRVAHARRRLVPPAPPPPPAAACSRLPAAPRRRLLPPPATAAACSCSRHRLQAAGSLASPPPCL